MTTRKRIAHIDIEDFKGVTCTMVPGAKTLLVGPNGSGKTARLMALQYAVLGHTSLGGRLDDTRKLAGPHGCSVAVTLDNGFRWDRSLTFNQRTAKASQNIRMAHGGAPTDDKGRQAYLENHVGAFGPMFDCSELLSLSPEKRRAFVLDLCAEHGAGVSRDDIVNGIGDAILRDQLGNGVVPGHVTPKGRGELIERLSKPWQQAVTQIFGMLYDDISGTTTELLTMADELLTAEISTSKAETARNRQASERLSQRKAELTVAAGTADDLKIELDKHQATMTELREQRANQQGRSDSIKTIDTEVQVATDTLHRLKTESKFIESQPRHDTAPTQKALDDHNDSEPDDEGLAKAHADANTAATEALTALSDNQRLIKIRTTTLQELETTIAGCKKALAEMADEPWHRASELATRFMGLDVWDSESGQEVMANPDWEALLVLMAEQILKMEQGTCQDHESALGDHETATEELACYRAKAKGLQADYDARNADVERCVENHTTYIFAHSKWSTVMSRLQGELVRCKDAIDKHKADVERLTASITDAEATVLRLQNSRNELGSAGGEANVGTLDTTISHAEVQVTELDNAYRGKLKAAALDEELTLAIQAADHANALNEVATVARKGLRDVREQIMADMVAPLTAAMGEFLGPDRKVYCDLTNERGTKIFDLGWIANDKKIPLPALSGGETALMMAALGYALASLDTSPLSVLCIEAAELDDFCIGLLMTCCERVSGNLSHIFVSTCHSGELVDDDWTVIDCGNAEGGS